MSHPPLTAICTYYLAISRPGPLEYLHSAALRFSWRKGMVSIKGTRVLHQLVHIQSFSPLSPRMGTQRQLKEALATAERVVPSFASPPIHRERTGTASIILVGSSSALTSVSPRPPHRHSMPCSDRPKRLHQRFRQRQRLGRWHIQPSLA
ncbi:hypothetical protein CGRA01v4_12280 [Colletotrichum graminicola]|nr:hypothetical protein CGRA01v4_12280 [Colletotrichum graminicola]